MTSSTDKMKQYAQLGKSSVYAYVIYCFLFFVLKERIFGNTHGYSKMWIFIYIFIFYVLLVFMNARLTSNELVCGTTQINVALVNSLYPLLFIFCVAAMIIEFYPGWLRAFSNTFGLSAAKMFGMGKAIKDTFSEARKQYILNNAKDASSNSENQLEFMKTIDMIYNDPTPLINELDLDMKKEEVKIEESLYLRRENRDGLTQEQINEIELFDSYGDYPTQVKFDNNNNKYVTKVVDIWKSWDYLKSRSIVMDINSGNKEIPDNEKLLTLKNHIIDGIKVKHNVGYFMWYLLLGIITSIISVNSMLLENCVLTDSAINAKYKDYISSFN